MHESIHSDYLHNFARFAGMCVLTLIVLGGCYPKHPLHPSYESLAEHGFYVYVLPKAELQQREWQETVRIWRYDFHCRYDDAQNNLRIMYRDKADQMEFELIIGHWSEVWDWTQETTLVPLNTNLAPDGSADFYPTSDASVALMFEDQFGIQVQVWSEFAITETIELVNQLEYIGPSPDTITDPWDNCR
jgi:hypothetical protein